MYFETIGQMKKQLGQLDKWLETAGKHAQAKSFDPNLFLGFRLAPDQFAFARQVQATCDVAKLVAARLSGKEAPKHEDNEKSLEDLRARVASVIAYLGGFTAKDFEQAATTAPQQTAALLEKIQIHSAVQPVEPTPAQLKTLHACIKKVTEDLDALRFNTGISALMVFTNEAMTWETKPASVLRTFLQLLAPFAPHVAEELWARLHAKYSALKAESLVYAAWPQFDPALLVEDTIEIPVQVNGKLRDKILIAAKASQQEIEAAALKAEKVQPFLEGKTIKKTIVIPGRLVNIVAV